MFELRFTVEAGALRRVSLRNEIEKYCFMRGLVLDLKELKGWFESEFLVLIKGPAEKADQVVRDIKLWGAQMEEEA